PRTPPAPTHSNPPGSPISRSRLASRVLHLGAKSARMVAWSRFSDWFFLDPLVNSSAVDLAPPLGLEWAHPLVQEWFVGKFGTPTEPQEQGWPHILAGRDTLICAPTGSGKTLAAFLACIDKLVRQALSGSLTDVTEVLYVSPLKALGNDIQKNLDVPLGEIIALAQQRGYLMAEIRTAVRTGDTHMHERQAMLRRPPHILVTTPESLYILLTARKSREFLRTVKTVIVDEIHAMADDKRGAHLALSLERLDALTGARSTRIGLSATQKPTGLIAEFLAGADRTLPDIVHVAQGRKLNLGVEVPGGELGPVASNEMWDEIYERIADLVRHHRSTLVFVNTRRLAERVGHHLAAILGADAVASHHGSLSRQRRLAVEGRLKAGELRVLVATASLELGIDIGNVDLVCQIGSPRSVAVALQRAGRSGHWRGATPKARFFATTRDELLECAALVRAIHLGELDRILIPESPLDVLAQQIVAACAADDWAEEDLFALVRRAYPYRSLTRAGFDEIVAMLAEGIAARRGRYSAYLHRDGVNKRLRGRRGARLAAITSGGAIPDNSLYTVRAEPEGFVVGTVDEDFAVESMRGDILLLGNNSWRIRRVQQGSMIVEDAQGAPPTVPFWRGEAPSRTAELSEQVAEVRATIHSLTEGLPPGRIRRAAGEAAAAAIDWRRQECALDQAGAEQAVEYIVAGRAILRTVPTQQTIVAERFFDESGGMQLVIPAPFGGRINKAWGLALRKRFCRSFNFELQAAATDNGLNISLSDQHSFPLADVFSFLQSASVEHLLEQAVLASPIFNTRWRWVAGRALALLRFMGGKKVPPQIQRMRSEDLLAAVFPEALACQENIEGEIKIPDHPLARETMKDALTEAMDIDGLKNVLDRIASGSIRCIAVETPVPSQFSHEILNANPYAYLDDAPLEERRARAVEMRRVLPESVLSEVGRLDPAAIAQVRADAWPDVRDAEELHDALLTLVAIPEFDEQDVAPAPGAGSLRVMLQESAPAWRGFFGQLAAERRMTRAFVDGTAMWVAAERGLSFAQIYPSAQFEQPLAEVETASPSADDALVALVSGWMLHAGPTTAHELSEILRLPTAAIDRALLRLEASGAILRGRFTESTVDEPEWCERRLLARIHRLTIGTLRKQIEPMTPAQFMRWLLRWQHVAPGSQLLGERGTLEALEQLQGFEAPARAWERQILARRVAGYDPKVLDQLCLTGAVGWGRLSPHPATLEAVTIEGRRVIPTSVAPITFFVREDAEWMIPRRKPEEQAQGLGRAASEALAFLRQRGASFFADVVRGTGLLKAEVET